MWRTILAIVACGALAGCGSQPRWEPAQQQQLFSPTAMRIHPVFTQVQDWTGDGKPDGVDALIEFQDQFGDSAKASGSVVFEIYEYQPFSPDPRGRRAVAPFLTAIDNVAAQRDHWNRTSRCYSFQLAWPKVNLTTTYVLMATFEKAGGGRFTDQIVLEPAQRERSRPAPATSPANKPAARTSQP
jgi:hypothetical protein